MKSDAAIRRLLAGGRPLRRHSAEVTSDRLLDDYERWRERLSGSELDAISTVRDALQRIADEDEWRRS